MNKIITWIKNIIGKSIENTAVDLTTKALILILSIVIIAIILFWDKLVEFLDYDIKMWVIIFIALLVLSMSKIYDYNKSKSIHVFFKYGMEWHVNINKNRVNSIEGPFCSRCQLEMTSMPLHCSVCDTEYLALNTNNIEEAKQKVQKIIEAELRGGKVLLVDWSTVTNSYPNSYFYLKNGGASTVKDISIEITLEIGGERRHVGIYEFEKIEPDKNKRIENSDPMRDVYNILKELDLIEFYSIDMSHEEEDEFGDLHEIPNFLEWKIIRGNFSCNLQLNVNYSLRDKMKNQQNKYIIEFKYLRFTPPEETNCNIIMSQIE